MEVLFGNETLTIKGCPFDSVEVHKDGLLVADIPLTDGIGFFSNTNVIGLSDPITLYPYNVVEIQNLASKNEIE